MRSAFAPRASRVGSIEVVGRRTMARLFGFVGNRADLGARVLELENKPLSVVAKGTTLGWGIGFYQAADVLLRPRPIDERQEIDVASLAKDLRADVRVG